jgi:hypothetical protein
VPDAGLLPTRWVVSGSRLLQNHRAAILESGSPPGLGQLVRAERLQTYRVHFEDENETTWEKLNARQSVATPSLAPRF